MSDQSNQSLKQPHQQSQDAPAGLTNTLTTIIVVLAILGILGILLISGLAIAAIFSPWARQQLSNHWEAVLIGIVAIALLWGLLSLWVYRRKGGQFNTKWRVAINFIFIPCIVITMMAPIAFSSRLMALFIELTLILVGALIPAVTHYLFLVTRRASILNEFIGNLSRLGLLLPKPKIRQIAAMPDHTDTGRHLESPMERQIRIESYFQRFETIYGELNFETEEKEKPALSRSAFVDRLICTIDRRKTDIEIRQAAVQVKDMFRVNIVIPIGLATILSTLGWLLVIQPNIKSAVPTLGQAIRTPQPVTSSNGTSPQPRADMGRSTRDGMASSPPSTPKARGPDSQTASAAPLPAAAGYNSTNFIAQLAPTWTPVSFAFLGAYFYGIQMLFRRFVRRDLGPNAYLAFSTRIIIAIIGTWVTIAAIIYLLELAGNLPSLKLPIHDANQLNQSSDWPEYFLVIGFIIGVFPRTIWQFIAAVLARWNYVKVKIPSIEAKQPLSNLDGLTVWHETRLIEEDVENIPNMATVDIVDIMLRTQIPAERLIGWIDQAILLSVIGPEDEERRPDDARSILKILNGDAVNLSAHSLHDIIRDLGLRRATHFVATIDRDRERELGTRVLSIDSRVQTTALAIILEGNYALVSAWQGIREQEPPDPKDMVDQCDRP